MEAFLEKTYNDPSHPAGFGGVKKLVEAAKQAGFGQEVSYGKVRKFLQTQETYSLTKPSRKATSQAHVVVAGLNAQHNIDLIDNHKYSSYGLKIKESC